MYKLLEKYLFITFSNTFFPIFLTLYIVTSIIFLVKIAALTSVIQIDFIELMQMYLYSTPTIFFYTLPISYFVGMTIAISRLSTDYETIIITSFGLNPIKVIKLLLPTTIVISSLLLIISLGLIPKAQYLKTSLLNAKKQEAQFNIKPSEYGQHIGEWFVYVNKERNNLYQDITLLQIEPKKDTFISAQYATISNTNGNMNLKLQNGKSFVVSDTLKEINFEEMVLNHTMDKPKNIKSLNDIIMYWDDRKSNKRKSENFTFNILISLFPLVSIFFCIAIGYFNPRYDSNKTTIYSFAAVVGFVVIVNQVAKLYPNTGLYALPIIWFSLGYIYYTLTTKKLY